MAQILCNLWEKKKNAERLVRLFWFVANCKIAFKEQWLEISVFRDFCFSPQIASFGPLYAIRPDFSFCLHVCGVTRIWTSIKLMLNQWGVPLAVLIVLLGYTLTENELIFFFLSFKKLRISGTLRQQNAVLIQTMNSRVFMFYLSKCFLSFKFWKAHVFLYQSFINHKT